MVFCKRGRCEQNLAKRLACNAPRESFATEEGWTAGRPVGRTLPVYNIILINWICVYFLL